MCDLIVYKQQLTEDLTTIEVSSDSFTILHVDEQDGVPTIWYETVQHPLVKKLVKFFYIGTGQNVPDNSIHVGSCKCGLFVWHVYQIVERK